MVSFRSLQNVDIEKLVDHSNRLVFTAHEITSEAFNARMLRMN